MNTRKKLKVFTSSKIGALEIKNRLVRSFFSRMKTSLVIASLLAIPITGFSDEVVYRISPDSQPKMSVEEARDAIALALDRTYRWQGIQRLYLDGDDLVAMVSRRDMSGKITTSYDQIGQEIIKENNFYKIPVKMGSSVFGLGVGRGDYIMRNYVFRWKSEKDAKLFIDAVYVLRQNKYGEKKQQ
jgi:hypothetical protein